MTFIKSFSLFMGLFFTTLLMGKDPTTSSSLSSILSKPQSAGYLIEHPTVKMDFSYIPAGSFKMGSPDTEKGRGRDENQVDVKLTTPFLMGTTEITQGHWLAVMGKTLKELIESKADPLGRGANLKNEPSATGENEPMCFVSYEDALEFCAVLTKRDLEAGLISEGYAYTLPTEAEWEYAARAGTTTVFSFGDKLTSEDANFYGVIPYGTEEKGLYREKTTPVKTFKPNPWQLYDVHGNVYEWCLDWYTEELAGGENPAEMSEGDSRCIRGGPWNRKATSLRSAYRYSYDPTQRTNNIGFRIILKKAP